MRRTYKKLFEKMIFFENLFLATRKAQKGKKMKKDTAQFNLNMERELLKLQKELKNQTYIPGAYRYFYVYDPKKRLISAAPYRDRVVHHAFCRIVEPIFDKMFIYDSYACRIAKGTHIALDRAQKFLRANKYILQCDIAKYFLSIDHGVLLAILGRRIKDDRVMRLAKKIITGHSTGLPIGNLTSQFFANLYLNELDYFIKFGLRKKHYIRYMDDFLVFGNDKRRLHEIKDEVKCFLENKLGLDLHPKKNTIFPVRIGIGFLGFRIFKEYRQLTKENIRLFLTRMRKFRSLFIQGLMSMPEISRSLRCWLAHAAYGNTRALSANLTALFFNRAIFSVRVLYEARTSICHDRRRAHNVIYC
ncbi:MAG: RNA-dependent DNA polymerase [Candidatus Omnitrophica bacterium CG_4_10_14_0_2_um_filter_44_9]|nr:MAG: RNA-dependent DNA polymerase [Candidatus Omnitrophica bacterium CG_4_10_14_0_8_um_filter_44_12]PIZ84385.1 MAG: RNA-dependent DNA polymerase [Candidatus Omnitrophica bacterium CG_4_10_14_0_2_um_filter_44_9]